MHRPARTMVLIGIVLGVLTSLARILAGSRHDVGTRRRRSRAEAAHAPMSAPAVERHLRPVPSVENATETAPPVAAPAWVEAIDGACPETHPVKVKLTSGIYHVPGGGSYGRTRPDRCYRDAAAAEADGFRAARR